MAGDGLKDVLARVNAQRETFKRERAEIEARERAEFAAAGGRCWACRDTGTRADSLHVACEECDRGRALTLGRAAARVQELITQMGLPPRRAVQTLDNFPRPFQSGYSEVQRFLAHWDGRAGLALSGERGRGKTGLLIGALKSAAAYYVARDQAARVAYVGGDLFEHLREGIKDGSHGPQMERLMRASLLALDDLGVERPTDWALERLYLVINARYEACLPVFYTTNYAIKTLRTRIGMRVVDRLQEMCESVVIEGVNLRYWLRGATDDTETTEATAAEFGDATEGGGNDKGESA